MGNCLITDPNRRGPISPMANQISRLYGSLFERNRLTRNRAESDPKIHQSSILTSTSGSQHQSRSSNRYLTDLVTGDSSMPLRSSTGHLNMSSHSHLMHDNGNLQKNHNNNIFMSSDNNNKSSLNNVISGSRIFMNNNNHLNTSNLNINNHDVLDPTPKIMICLTDFIAKHEGDLTVRKGDRLMVSGSNDPDWFLVEHIGTKRKGFVPKDYLASDAIEMEEWFFPRINRRDAEKILLSEDYCRGTYLVRHSEHSQTGYSLSIRDEDRTRPTGCHIIKHYKIKTDKGYYVAPRAVFQTMTDLIAYYSNNQNGLCHKLVRPCPKPKPSFWPDRGDELQRTEIVFGRKIGTGCFGEVYHGYYRNSIEVAIKTLKQGTMSPQAFLEEAVIMRKCRHSNLVPLYGVCSQEEPLLIITEYMCNGSLLEYLRSPEGKSLKLTDLMDMASQIAYGMAYLEKVKLIHRDLAARNILVGEKGEVKVADFGLARVIEDSEYTARQGTRFPIKWTAPEAVVYGKFSIKSDVWSYGILLYELITYGTIPYPAMQNKEVIDQIQRGYRLPKPTQYDCPDEVYKRMCDCWQSDPEKRPTFDYLATFFENYNVSAEQSYRDAVDCF